MSPNTFVVIFVLVCLTAACRAVDIDALGSNPDDWLSSHKSPFNAFFNIASGRSRHNDVVCSPKVFQIAGYEPTSGDSMVWYVDGKGTRKAMHVMSPKSRIEYWAVDFYQSDLGTGVSYRFNGTLCQCRKFKGNYSDVCLPQEVSLNKTFTIGLNPSAVKVNLWMDKSSRMPVQFLFTANENLPIVISVYGSTYYYYDASLTVDEKAFKLPSHCPKPCPNLNFN